MQNNISSQKNGHRNARKESAIRRAFALVASSLLAFSSFPISSALAQQRGGAGHAADLQVVAASDDTSVVASDALTVADVTSQSESQSASHTLPNRILDSGILSDDASSGDTEPIYVDLGTSSVTAPEMDSSEAQSVACEHGTTLSDVEETVPAPEELPVTPNPVMSALSALGDGVMSLFSSEPSSPFSNVTLRWLTPDSVSVPDFDDSRLSVFYDSDARASAMMRFEAVLSGNEVYKAGQVQIAIPKAFLTGRDGKPVGQASFSVPQAPSNRTTFAYVETENSYVLQNCVPLAPGSSIAIGFSVANIVPHMIESGSVSEPVTATISLAGTGFAPVTAGPLTASFTTRALLSDGSVQVRHERTTSSWNGVPDELRNLVDESAYSCMEFYSWGYVMGSQPYGLSANATAGIVGEVEGKSAIVLGTKTNSGTVSVNDSLTSAHSASIGEELASLNIDAPTYLRTYVAVPKDAAPAGETCEVSLSVEYSVTGTDSGNPSISSSTATKEYMNPATRGSVGTFGVSAESGREESLALNRLARGMSASTMMGATSIELRGARANGDVTGSSLFTDYGFASPILMTGVNANTDDPDVIISSVSVGEVRTFTWKEFETAGYGYGALASDGWKLIGAGEFGYAADPSPKDVTITFYDAPDIASANTFNALGTLTYGSDGKASVKALRDDVTWDGTSVLRIAGNRSGHIVSKAEYAGDGVTLTACPEYTFLPTDVMKDIAERQFSNSDVPYISLRAMLRVAIGMGDGGVLSYTDDVMCSGMLGGSSTYVSSDMSVSFSNDVAARNVKLRYAAAVHEQTNLTDYKNLSEARDADMTFADLRGTWRILLHPGIEVDMSSVSVGTQSDVKNVRVLRNFRGSGRDMLVVTVANAPSFTNSYRCGRYGYGDDRTLTFSASYSWQAHELYGDDVRCVSSYESDSENFGSVSGYKGEPDTPSTLGNNSSYGVSEEVGTLMDGISDNPDAPGKFVYALSRGSLGVNTQSTSGYSKQASYAGGSLTNELVVPENGAYSYRLSYSNGVGGAGTIGDLVIYDSIESAGDWHGTFAGVDVSAFESVGASPKVYYSTADVDLSTSDGRDLTNGSIWTDVMPQADKVRAIAVDATRTASGDRFEFDDGTEMWATVNMVAPSAAQVSPSDPSLAYATNGNALSAKNESIVAYTLNGQARELSGGTVTVKLTRYDLSGTIAFADEKDNDGMRPKVLTLRLMRDGKYEGHSLRWSATEGVPLSDKLSFDFRETYPNIIFPASDADGNPHYYTYELSSDADGTPIAGYSQSTEYDRRSDCLVGNITFSHVPETVTVSGEKKWEAPSGTQLPNSVEFKVQISDNSWTMPNATAASGWRYEVTGLRKYKNGQLLEHPVSESSYVSGFVSRMDGNDAVNTYHPYARLSLVHEVGNEGSISDAARTKARASFYAFVEKDGNPASLTLSGKVGDEAVEVSNGSIVDVAPGQSLVFDSVPSDITVRFVRADLSDGWKDSGDDEKEVELRAGVDESVTFTSTYSSIGRKLLDIRKELSGRALENGQFTFEMVNSAGNVIATGRNGADGTVFLPSVSATEKDDGKDIAVKVRERRDDTMNGYAWDGSIWTVTLHAADDGAGNMTFTEECEKDDSGIHSPVAKIVFKNSYSARGDLYLSAWKTLSGMELQNQQFEFQLVDAESGDVVATAKNDAEGNVTFGPIPLDQTYVGRELHYVASEIAGDDERVTYDDAKFSYTVKVSDKGDGTLGFETTTDVNPVFRNLAKPGTLTVTKQVNGSGEGIDDSEHMFRVTLAGKDFYSTPYVAIYGDMLVIGKGVPASDMFGAALSESWELKDLEAQALVDADDSGRIIDDRRPWKEQVSSIAHVTVLDNVSPFSTVGWFQGMVNLEDADMSGLSVGALDDARGMFMGCSSLTAIYAADDADWSGIGKTAGMYDGCTSLGEGASSGLLSLFAAGVGATDANANLTKKATVRYDSNDGREMKDPTLRVVPSRDGVYSDDKVPTRLGYDFSGWYADAECTQRIDEGDVFSLWAGTGNDELIVYAGWTPKTMKILFVRDPLCDDEYNAEPGDQVGQLYEYDGWGEFFVAGAESIPWDQVSLNVPENIVPCPEGYYYDYNYMFDPDFYESFAEGMDAKQCWMTSAWHYDWCYGDATYDGSEEMLPDYNGETIMVHVGYNNRYYTIKYDSNGGDGGSGSQGGNWPDESVPNHYTWAGRDWTFDGWYTKPEGGTRVAGMGSSESSPNMTVMELVRLLIEEGTIADESAETLTLYGHWTPLYKTLHFNANGGSSISDMQIRCSDVIGLDKYVPIRDGYMFTGWYPTNECKRNVKFADDATGNTIGYSTGSGWESQSEFTIYAGWKAVDYEQHGTIGNPNATVDWHIDASGKLTLRPTDDIYGELTSGDHPWQTYKDDITEIYVESGVSTTDNAGISGLFSELKYVTYADVRNLDVSKACYLSSMFSNCRALVSAEVGEWDTSHVEDISSFYAGCSSLETPNISLWDIGNVQRLNYVFSNCSKLTSLDLSQWNTANVLGMYRMFYNCTNLTSISQNFVTSKVIDMDEMFRYCSKLTSLDVSNFDVHAVQYMTYLFQGCSSLESLDCIRDWDVSSVTNMRYIFADCRSLKSLDCIFGWDVNSVRYLGSAFNGCSALTSLDLTRWDVSNVAEIHYYPYIGNSSTGLFANCTSLTSLNISGWNLRNVTSLQNICYRCPALTDLNVSGINTENVISIEGAFCGCSSLTEIDLSSWNTDNVQLLGRNDTSSSSYDNCGMFQSCSSLRNVNLNGWTLPNATYLDAMFYECKALETVNLDTWTLGNVISARNMFYNCEKLLSLDLSRWQTSNMTNVSYMFYGCKSLNSLKVAGWDTAAVTNAGSVFSIGNSYGSDYPLKELDLTGWTTENIADSYKMPSLPAGLLKFTLPSTFINKSSNSSFIPSAPSSWGASQYTGKWVSKDAMVKGPYDANELGKMFASDPASVAGTWEAETRELVYHVSFEPGELPGNVPVTPIGTMESQDFPATDPVTLYTFPTAEECGFYAFGYKPVGWKTNKSSKIYDFGESAAIVQVGNQVGETVTISPVWEKDETVSPTPEGNTITFTLRPGETSVLDNLAPGTSYMVEELSQSGWELLRTEGNASGTIFANDVSQVTFVNQKKILMPGVTEEMEFTIAGTKTLDEKPAGGYSFELLLYGTRVATATSDEHGAFSFDLVAEYDELENGGLDYVVREIPGGDASVEYDTHEATVHAYAEDGYVKLSGTEALAFENRSKPATLSLSQTVPAGANENVSFVYSVKTGPSPSDVTEVTLVPGDAPVEVAVTPGYVARIYPVFVPAGFTSQASDAGLSVTPDGGIQAGQRHAATISSTYRMTGKSVIPVTVTLSHAAMTGGDFSFAMVEKNPSEESEGKELQSTVNSESGHAAFDVTYSGSELDSSKNATTYIVTQDPEPALSQWKDRVVMDGSSHEVKVGWHDNGDGSASPVVEYSDSACSDANSVLFTNAAKTVDLVISKKTLGLTSAASSSRFGYSLTIEPPFSSQEGDSMSAASLPGEPDTYVMVGEDGNEGEFSNGGTVELSSADGASIVIKNVPVGSSYRVSSSSVPQGFDDSDANRASGTIPLSASGEVKVPLASTYASAGTLGVDALSIARGFVQSEGQFSFTARQVLDGIIQPSQVKVQNGADGLVAFPLGRLSAGDDGKTVTYDLSQDALTDSMYETDPLHARVTLSLADDGAGNMGAEVSSVEYLAMEGEASSESVEEHMTLTAEQGKPVFVTSYGVKLPMTGEVPWTTVALYLLAATLIVRGAASAWIRSGRRSKAGKLRGLRGDYAGE